MGCSEFAPLVSRYLDEDLEGEDLDALLGHLSDCPGCRQEMEGMERLRGWLQVLDAVEGVPVPPGAWGLEDLLRKEETGESAAREGRLFPAADRRGAVPRKRRAWRLEWRGGRNRPAPLGYRLGMRLALALLVAGVVAIGFSAYERSRWVDVQELRPSAKEALSFPPAEEDDIHYYVAQHATHQPWEQYGDEVPMLQLASTPSQ